MFKEEFWDNFVEHYWDKQPGVFRDTGFIPLTELQLLGLIQRFVGQLKAGRKTAGLRVFADDRAISNGERATLINLQLDHVRSFTDLVNTAEQALRAESFALILNDIGLIDASIQHSIAQFINPLLSRTGLPSRECEIGVFGGSYSKTPFGIHRDLGNDNFTFGIVGEKRFLLWPPGYFYGDNINGTGATNDGQNIYCDENAYQHFKQDAIALTVRPGDVMYWPDWWHTADVDPGQLQITLSLGLWKYNHLATFGSELVRNALAAKLREQVVFKGACSAEEELPEFVQTMLDALAQIQTEGSVEKLAKQWWQHRRNNYGFVTELE